MKLEWQDKRTDEPGYRSACNRYMVCVESERWQTWKMAPGGLLVQATCERIADGRCCARRRAGRCRDGVRMSMSVAEYRELARKPRKPRKYRNKPTVIDGHRFDSRKEAKRYGDLVLMQKAGEIWDLQVHPRFKLEVNGVWVAQYTADFAYRERQQFKQIVEDCKSDVTKRIRDWPIRKRLMLAIHGIEVREL